MQQIDESNALFAELFEFIWTGSAAIFLFFMQTGYLMLSGGASQLPNVQNGMFNLVLALCASTFWFWAAGYGFARGTVETSNAFIGERGFALDGDQAISRHDFVYHWGYLQVAVAIASAGLLERARTVPYLIVASLLGLIVFPVVVFWMWTTRGWLSPTNVDAFLLTLDYAGSGVVHVVGGTAALVGTLLLGARRSVARRRTALKKGEATTTLSSVDKDGDAVMNFVGSLAIWFGSYGVCQVRMARAADNTEFSALVGPNMVLSAAFAGLVAAAFGAVARPKRRLRFLANGIVAGLAAIGAGAPWMQPYSAMAVGTLAGVVFCAACVVLEHTRLDDTADAVAVHLLPGVLGLVVAALFVDYGLVARNFADPARAADVPRIIEQDQGRLLGAQLLAVLCIIAWTAGVLALFLVPLRLLGVLRIDEESEVRGLDTLIDPRAESVRQAVHVTRTVPSNDLTTQQRECARSKLWLTGDCVEAGGMYYHPTHFVCVAHDTLFALLDTYVLHNGLPYCTTCAVLNRPPRPYVPAKLAGDAPKAAKKKADKEQEEEESSYDYTYVYESGNEEQKKDDNADADADEDDEESSN